MSRSRTRGSAASLRRALRPSAARGARRSPAQRSPASGRTLSAKSTQDHALIQRWVEARGGHPATVKRTASSNQGAGILRIDFPGFSGQRSLKPVDWDEWFRIFDERNLTFLYQDRTASGKQSRFNKLVCRQG